MAIKNFEKFKNMGIDELAEKLAIVELNAVCGFADTNSGEYSDFKAIRKQQWIKYFESEAEE